MRRPLSTPNYGGRDWLESSSHVYDQPFLLMYMTQILKAFIHKTELDHSAYYTDMKTENKMGQMLDGDIKGSHAQVQVSPKTTHQTNIISFGFSQ